ncbi:MAG: late competence development ComFB family protein [Clostridiales Family XIII bacterium]|jgi:competence protein ComFB|nr:late competence development ComFB family protein [Clostridiales Family XIII bacterium]
MIFDHNLNNERPVNLVRIVAEELLPSVMKKLGVEGTEENREDILALALNSIPTKYVTTEQGKQYAQLIEVYKLQYETDITTALTKASIKVMRRPRGSK